MSARIRSHVFQFVGKNKTKTQHTGTTKNFPGSILPSLWVGSKKICITHQKNSTIEELNSEIICLWFDWLQIFWTCVSHLAYSIKNKQKMFWSSMMSVRCSEQSFFLYKNGIKQLKARRQNDARKNSFCHITWTRFNKKFAELSFHIFILFFYQNVVMCKQWQTSEGRQ